MEKTPIRIFAKDDRPVFRIIIYCLSLAFAVLIASLETVRSTASGFSFEVTGRTVLAFLLGAAIVVPCFRAIFLSARQFCRNAALAIVVAIGLLSFLYPLRFVPSDKFAPIFAGLAIAACVLSVIGGMLFIINRFLNADQQAIERS